MSSREENLEDVLKYFRSERRLSQSDILDFLIQEPEPRTLFFIDQIVQLLSTSKKVPQISNGEKLTQYDKKINELESKYDTMLIELKEIKGLLWKKESKKDESIIYYKEKASRIEAVQIIYCKLNADGVSFLTIFNPENISNTLKEIVNIQIELENRYEDILFDFSLKPTNSTFSISSEWSPLFLRRK